MGLEVGLPDKNSEQEHDELYEAFDSRRIIKEEHPDLGFESLEELKACKKALNKLLKHPDTSERVIGKYQLLLDQQEQFAKSKQIKDDSRRSFIRNSFLALVGLPVVVGLGEIAYNWYTSTSLNKAQLDMERRKATEESGTLGTTPIRPTLWGWTARYPKEGVYSDFIPAEGPLRIEENGWLTGPRGSLLRETGFTISLWDRSDGTKIPTLTRIIAMNGESITNSEAWILRDGSEKSSQGIDTRAVILQKDDPSLLNPITVAITLRKIPNQNATEARIVKPIPV